MLEGGLLPPQHGAAQEETAWRRAWGAVVVGHHRQRRGRTAPGRPQAQHVAVDLVAAALARRRGAAVRGGARDLVASVGLEGRAGYRPARRRRVGEHAVQAGPGGEARGRAVQTLLPAKAAGRRRIHTRGGERQGRTQSALILAGKRS